MTAIFKNKLEQVGRTTTLPNIHHYRIIKFSWKAAMMVTLNLYQQINTCIPSTSQQDAIANISGQIGLGGEKWRWPWPSWHSDWIHLQFFKCTISPDTPYQVSFKLTMHFRMLSKNTFSRWPVWISDRNYLGNFLSDNCPDSPQHVSST